MLKAALLAIIAVTAALSQGITMTVVLLDGRTGNPIANQRMRFFAGATPDPRGLRQADFTLETATNGQVEFKVDTQQKEQWLQAWAEGFVICQKVPNETAFNVKEIATIGVVAGNTCGSITQNPIPGVLVLYFRKQSFFERMKH